MGKSDSNRVYVCCPFCSATLLQIGLAKDGFIRCEHCKQFVGFEVEDGRITVWKISKKQDEPAP